MFQLMFRKIDLEVMIIYIDKLSNSIKFNSKISLYLNLENRTDFKFNTIYL